MEELTCMEYLFQSVLNNHTKDINQNILLNASNEFRNVWSLVKKLRDLARVDVQKITRFLDAVQVGLEKTNWSAATGQCVHAEREYRQIRRYIRSSFLDEFRVSLYIITVDPRAKREKKKQSQAVSVHRRPNFRNKQINKQNNINYVRGAFVKNPDNTKQDANVMNLDNKTHDANIKMLDIIKSDTKANAVGNIKPETNVKSYNTKADKKEQEEVGENDNSKLKTNDHFRMTNESSNQKEEEKDEKSLHHSREMEGIVNSNITEAVSHTANTERDDMSKNTEHETKTEGNEHDVVIESIPNMPEVKDETLEKRIVNNVEEEKNHRSNSSNDTDKRIDTNIVDDKHDATNPAVENQSLVADTSGSHSKNEGIVQNTDLKRDDLRDRGRHDAKCKDVKPKSIDISYLVSERMTEISYECKPEEIINELNRVYDSDWNLAYCALTGCQPSNGMKNTIDFLGEILKRSEDIVRKTTELLNIMVSSSLSKSLETLKQEFLTRHLRELQIEHCIEYHCAAEDEYAVNLYSAKCIELSWFMFTRRPPMVFDYNSRPMLLEDLFDIFKPYRNQGNCIHYVVWPAIRRCQGGRVVCRGIADFR